MIDQHVGLYAAHLTSKTALVVYTSNAYDVELCIRNVGPKKLLVWVIFLSFWGFCFRPRFQDFDIDDGGSLGRKEFMRALNLALAGEVGGDGKSSSDFTVGDVASKEEAATLMDRLDTNRDGRVCWEVRYDPSLVVL